MKYSKSPHTRINNGSPALASLYAEYPTNNDGSPERIDRLGWLGKETDSESGLRGHGVRKYDRANGRFVSMKRSPSI